jgi:hypothetical protein
VNPRRIFTRRRRRLLPWLAPLAVLAAGGVAFIAASSRDTETTSAPEPAEQPAHIHGLGINPRDGSLFIATHSGLYRYAASMGVPERVGDSRQDTMGFAVVGRDHFIGSGHPDVRANLPPLLGLIESRDAGRSWKPVSLLGEADFHALRVVPGGIVGYDATNGRVMVSPDGGRTWRSRRAPAPFVDLVSDGSARLLLASTQTELLRSSDGGATWMAVSEAPGLLSWPARDRLYVLAADGGLWLSADQGRRWRHIAEVGGTPTAFLVDGSRMYAALHDGSVRASDDRGRTWRPLAWAA